MTAAAFVLASCGSNKVTVNGEKVELEEGIYAVLETSMGDVLIDFHEDKAPITCANFIALAEGNHPKADPKFAGKAYYDGTIFHRVIPKFMIQGGDPDGTGAGGPGYQFKQEIHPELKHDKAGVVSMANAGPGTNGSQFFITHNATPHLDGGYNVFAQVLNGQDIVEAIGSVERNRSDKPVEDVVLEHVEIIRVGKDAKAWDAPAVYVDQLAADLAAQEAAKAAVEEEINAAYPEAQVSSTGLRYIIEAVGEGEKPVSGQKIEFNYAGYLMDGSLFDTSWEEVARANGKFDENRPYAPLPDIIGQSRMVPGMAEGLAMLNVGGKAKFIIPPYLGWGDRGAGNAVPPNASVVFDVELVRIVK